MIVEQASSLSSELQIVCSRVASMETLLSAFVSTRKVAAATPAETPQRPALDVATLTQRLEEAETEAEVVDGSGDARPAAGRKWRRVTDLDLLSMRLEEADEAIDNVESTPDSMQLLPPKSSRRQRPFSLPDLEDFSRMMEAGKEDMDDGPATDAPEAEEKRPLYATNEVKELLQVSSQWPSFLPPIHSPSVFELPPYSIWFYPLDSLPFPFPAAG